MRKKVLLPLPLGPMMTTTSPRATFDIDAAQDVIGAEELVNALRLDHPLRGGATAGLVTWNHATAPLLQAPASLFPEPARAIAPTR